MPTESKQKGPLAQAGITNGRVVPIYNRTEEEKELRNRVLIEEKVV